MRSTTKYYEELGLVFREGRWTHQEMAKLHENFAKYVQKHAELLETPLDLITFPKKRSKLYEIRV